MDHIDLLARGSSPEVGSSKINSYGFPSKAMATDNFLLLPPDNYLDFLNNYVFIPNNSTI